MDHMNFIVDIGVNDVTVLREKEATYQGSWKKAGGRSAWFMMRRNMDRLITMLAPPPEPKGYGFNLQNVDDTIAALGAAKPAPPRGESYVNLPGTPGTTVAILQHIRDCFVAEDIFVKIQEHPGGEDGTVLAVVRDLRRYLLLVEAEMASRWDKEKKHAGKFASELSDIAKRGVENTESKPSLQELDINLATRSERRVPRYETETEIERKLLDELEINTEHVNDPDYVEPWIVNGAYFSNSLISVENREKFWSHRAPAVHVLEPHVAGNVGLPRALHGYFVLNSDDSWTLDIRRVPKSIRNYFPDLGLEKNMKEHEELPEWQKLLYAWNKEGQKFCLTPGNVAWHVEK
jgi:hypothetical protein